MSLLLSLLIVIVGLSVIRVLVDLPFALLHWIHFPGWFGIAIALFLFSWIIGSKE